MKMSKREIIIGMTTLAAVLFGFTYWMAGSNISEQKEMASEKVRLRRQIQLHKRILEEKENWIGRLDTLQADLPIYDRRIPVSVLLSKEIKGMADQHNLDLTSTVPGVEKKVGTLYEVNVACQWVGKLDAMVHFLYALHAQGIRFDVWQINIKPIAKQDGMLRGSMSIDCAYRREKENE